MTRDEYVKWLEQLDESLPFDGLIDGDKEVDLHEMIFDLCEMLKQQTCEDAVSRQAVEEIINDIRDCISVDGYWAILERLKKLPSVNPQTKTGWIPVSERLPEIHQDVILSLRSLDVVVGFKAETEPYFYHYGYIDPQNVLAWMPVPTPYVLQESEDER